MAPDPAPVFACDAMLGGLANCVVPADRLEAETLALARKVASASPAVLALGKRAFYGQLALDRPAAYCLAERVMVEKCVIG